MCGRRKILGCTKGGGSMGTRVKTEAKWGWRTKKEKQSQNKGLER